MRDSKDYKRVQEALKLSQCLDELNSELQDILNDDNYPNPLVHAPDDLTDEQYMLARRAMQIRSERLTVEDKIYKMTRW